LLILKTSFERIKMRIGYARVSTEDQNLTLQLDALKKAECDQVFQDQMSGTRADRPGLKDALSHLRPGDTFVVWKLDRLGRGMKALVDLVTELEGRKVNFQSLTDKIDTSTPAQRFFFHIMASLAQMERELIVERTRAGLAAARRQGRVGGRKRQMTESKMVAARQLLEAGTPPRDVAKNLGVSVPTLYRWLPASARD
jgi:DNA invertase Pin-like site-specific DNA recombinase